MEKKGNIVFCHGFNVRDNGAGTIDQLIPYVEHRNVLHGDYGHFNLLGVRYYNKNVARTIAGMTPPDTIGVGHSNGCAVLLMAAEFGAKLDRLILINPALDKDTVFPQQIKRIDIFHNKYDNTVWWSKWLPNHVWGAMGKDGSTTGDYRVHNHETHELFGIKGHSAIFDVSGRLADYIKKELIE